MNFTQFANKVEKFDIITELKIAVEKTKHKAIENNKEELLTGKDAFGKNLNEYVSPEYAKYKQTLNPAPPSGVADLNLTGDFQSKFYADVSLFEKGVIVSIDSTDIKRDKLVKRDGEEIFGNNQRDSDNYANGVVKVLEVQIDQKL